MSAKTAITETINSVSVETPQGYKTFSLVHGDITQLPADLLVLSAYGNASYAPEGQIVEALRQQYEIVVTAEPRWLNFSGQCWTSFQEQIKSAPFSSILTVFMPQLAWNDNPRSLFEEAVFGVFASLAALEYKGRSFPCVSLPVLYGHRVLTEHALGDEYYSQIIEILIRQGLHWLRKSDHTHTIQFVVYEKQQLPAWDAAMNTIMGRSLIAGGTDAVLTSLCQEIVHIIRSQPDVRLAGATGPLADALLRTNLLSIENICVWGRKLVEAMLAVLLPNLGIKPDRELASNIEALGRSKSVAPWITSYMHSLRIFGNESVHARSDAPGYHPARLDHGDLVSALSAIRSLLTIWPTVANRLPGNEQAPQS